MNKMQLKRVLAAFFVFLYLMVSVGCHQIPVLRNPSQNVLSKRPLALLHFARAEDDGTTDRDSESGSSDGSESGESDSGNEGEDTSEEDAGIDEDDTSPEEEDVEEDNADQAAKSGAANPDAKVGKDGKCTAHRWDFPFEPFSKSHPFPSLQQLIRMALRSGEMLCGVQTALACPKAEGFEKVINHSDGDKEVGCVSVSSEEKDKSGNVVSKAGIATFNQEGSNLVIDSAPFSNEVKEALKKAVAEKRIVVTAEVEKKPGDKDWQPKKDSFKFSPVDPEGKNPGPSTRVDLPKNHTSEGGSSNESAPNAPSLEYNVGPENPLRTGKPATEVGQGQASGTGNGSGNSGEQKGESILPKAGNSHSPQRRADDPRPMGVPQKLEHQERPGLSKAERLRNSVGRAQSALGAFSNDLLSANAHVNTGKERLKEKNNSTVSQHNSIVASLFDAVFQFKADVKLPTGLVSAGAVALVAASNKNALLAAQGAILVFGAATIAKLGTIAADAGMESGILDAIEHQWEDLKKNLTHLMNQTDDPEIKKKAEEAIQEVQGAQKDVEATKKTQKEINLEILSDMKNPDKVKDIIEKALEKNDKVGGKMQNFIAQGGEEKLREDFDSLPGQVEISRKGVRTKKLPNGDTAVDRTPLGREEGKSTLEIQRDAFNTGYKDYKLKIRYE